MKPFLRILIVALLILTFQHEVLTAQQTQVPPAVPASKDKETPSPQEKVVETQHEITINGNRIAYRALAGDIQIKDEKDAAKANIFYIAYLAQKADAANRPLTFVFNGGPGSSSVWLHMGAFGPKRIRVDEQGSPGAPPFTAITNENSLLDITDLVFIDPVSTGFSRPAPGKEAKDFHEVAADVESIGEFIRIFLARQQRFGSPLFIAGESYGTIRAAGLVDYLQRRFSIAFNGVVLISAAIDTSIYLDQTGNNLPFVVALPAYTAAAWYYKKLPADLQADFSKAIRESEDFAMNVYSLALIKGSALSTDERKNIAASLSRFTGISQEEIMLRNLKIDRFTFTQKLLEKERRVIGILDSRYSGYPNYFPAESFAQGYSYALYDPSVGTVDSAFHTAFQQYLQKELNFKSEQNYEVLAQPVARSWNYGSVTNRFLNTADNLRAAMTLNPYMKVFFASGYFDLVTTPTGTEYIVTHLNIEPELEKNITTKFYESGHMMYMHYPSLIKLKQDLAAFYDSAHMHK
ncbi:MAG TPA: peptidase S10 [Acidobacteriota bacterium]|nr:peptidase S10 [Acidobacteriota bacterium]